MKSFKLEKYTMTWKYVVVFIHIIHSILLIMSLWELISPIYFAISICLYTTYVFMTLSVNGISKVLLFTSIVLSINVIILTYRHINCNFNTPQVLSLIAFGISIGYAITSVFVKLEKIAEKES